MSMAMAINMYGFVFATEYKQESKETSCGGRNKKDKNKNKDMNNNTLLCQERRQDCGADREDYIEL